MHKTPLAATMAQLGVSQGELVRRTGLARQTVFDAYHGKIVSLDTWVKMAKALAVPIARISPLAADELSGLVVR